MATLDHRLRNLLARIFHLACHLEKQESSSSLYNRNKLLTEMVKVEVLGDYVLEEEFAGYWTVCTQSTDGGILVSERGGKNPFTCVVSSE